MKLLMIGSDTAAVQGIQGAFWNTLKGFHKFFERIDIICPFVRKPVNSVLFGNVYFYPLPKGKVLSPLFVLRQGLSICRRWKPDLIAIHSYGMQFMAWGALLLARKLGYPFVVEVHHIEGVPKAAESMDIFRRCSAWLFLRTVSNEARAFRVTNEELPPILVKWGIPPERIKVVYSIYLDRTIFHPLPEKKQYDIIFVGRLVPNKGLPIIVESFKYLQREIPQAKLHIIGRGPLEGWLAKNLKGLDGIEHTRFLPSLYDIAKAYNQARVVICASYAEGGPRYVVEAMSCGLPVVSTPVGLMKEVVRDGETGFLLKDWSPKEMAEKIALLLTDRNLYEKCSENAQIVAAQFDYDLTINSYAMFYRRLLQQS